MNAADVMTTKVVTVAPESSIGDAAKLMLQYRISGLPVLNQKGELVGMVTEGDLLRRGETGTARRHPRWLEFILGPGRLLNEYVHTYGRKIGEVMTSNPVCIGEDVSLEDVVDTLERHRVKRLPVMRDGKLVGILSRANLVQALATVLPHAEGPRPEDSEIRKRILDEIDRIPWSPGNQVNVTVRDGIAELWGTIFDDRERQALRVAAENVAGVKEIEDHVLFVEPYSGTAFPSQEGESSRSEQS
jgi:CBS domain-containing protein